MNPYEYGDRDIIASEQDLREAMQIQMSFYSDVSIPEPFSLADELGGCSGLELPF